MNADILAFRYGYDTNPIKLWKGPASLKFILQFAVHNSFESAESRQVKPMRLSGFKIWQLTGIKENVILVRFDVAAKHQGKILITPPQNSVEQIDEEHIQYLKRDKR